jgi:putrescine importer
VLCVHYVGGDPTKPLWTLAPFYRADLQPSLVVAGAAIACYSFLGFDSVTTLTEETKDPRRTIPRAIMLITLIGGGIFVGTAYVVQLAHPGAQFANVDAAASEIAKAIGGDVFVSLFMIGLIVGQFASGLAAQSSASRLLYAMGRDAVLPPLFGRLHPRFRTPVNNLLACAVVALLALTMDVTTSTSFINFGAFVAFAFVNLAVIFHYHLGRGAGQGERSLRAWVLNLLFPLVGLVADVWLLVSLDSRALTLGLVWLALGVAYLLHLTGLLRRDPPELDFSEQPQA